MQDQLNETIRPGICDHCDLVKMTARNILSISTLQYMFNVNGFASRKQRMRKYLGGLLYRRTRLLGKL